MRKKKDEVTLATDLNQNILNIITPSGIDFSNTNANLGEDVGKIYCISKYPADCDYGWLAELCNLEGSATTIEYRYAFPDRMISVMNKRISELRTNLETVKEESDRQKITQGIEDLREMINRISVKNEPVGYVNIMIFIQALNDKELEARIKRVASRVAISECNIKILKYRQLEALKAMSPYGLPDREKVSNMGERNMPMSTFTGGFPMANAGLNDPNGFYMGKTKNNRIVRLNMWLRNKDRVNSNWFISGVPGVGKSTAIKLIATKEYALGTKIIFFDPEKEYMDLCRSPYINGDIIDCTGGKSGRINPLQVRTAPKVLAEELSEHEKMEDFFEYDTDNGTSDLALYIQQLRLFFSLYFGKSEFSSDIKVMLEKCLIELYKEFNITWDTDISQLKNEDFPILSDLYNLISRKIELADSEYERGVLQKLSNLLYSCAEGADKDLWNGHTTLKSNADFIDLNVSGLLEVDENVKRAQFYNITMWAWQQMSLDRNEKVLFGIDEGYLFVDEDNPELLKFIRNISKRDRKYEGGLMFITHSVVDILDPAVKRYGQAIIDNACYKFIMGTDGKNLEETTKLFNFSEREQTILSSKNRGQGVFMCGGIRLDLKVDVRTEFLELFGQGGGR